MNSPWEHNIKWNKADIQNWISYGFSCIRYPKYEGKRYTRDIYNNRKQGDTSYPKGRGQKMEEVRREKRGIGSEEN